MTRQSENSSLPCVLVVDQLDTTHEVLSTMLERRGVSILQARRAGAGLELARRHHPDVIVLDVDDSTDCDDGPCARLQREAQLQETSIVLLGSTRGSEQPDGAEFVRKPYHYGPLIRRIEALLERRRAA